MKAKKTTFFTLVSIFTVLSIVLYVILWFLVLDKPITIKAFNLIIERKFAHVIAMSISAVAITVSTLVFQTVTKNRILTPSVIGFDSIFLTTQTVIVFFFGSSNQFFANPYLNFITTTFLMVGITFLMYISVLKKNKNNIVLLLLMGMIIATLSRSFNGFLTRIMNPDELQTVISASTVSITNINTKIVYLALPVLAVVIAIFARETKVLDVMVLGENQAINLGVDYNKKTYFYMILISVLMAVATALVGPITFLGLLTVNMSKEILKTNKHLPIMIASALLGIIALVLGQLIIEQLKLNISVTILLNLIGGVYMIYLLLRANK